MNYFGPVSFADYAHDMDELSRNAAAVVEKLVQDIAARDKIIAAILLENGGKTAVHQSTLERIDRGYIMERWENVADMSIVMQAKLA